MEFNHSLADKFNMTLLELKNILIKHGAEDYYVGSLYPHELCFKTIDECVNFATSDEMLPHIIMMKLND